MFLILKFRLRFSRLFDVNLSLTSPISLNLKGIPCLALKSIRPHKIYCVQRRCGSDRLIYENKLAGFVSTSNVGFIDVTLRKGNGNIQSLPLYPSGAASPRVLRAW